MKRIYLNENVMTKKVTPETALRRDIRLLTESVSVMDCLNIKGFIQSRL